MAGKTGDRTMKAALWTKLKSTGSVGGFTEEMDRFALWLPVDMLPLIASLRRWVQRFREEDVAECRIDLELAAIRDIRDGLNRVSDNQLLAEFLDRTEAVVIESRQARRSVLQGEPVASDLEERMVGTIQIWLHSYQHDLERRGMAAWLLRLIEMWRLQKYPITNSK
ncbi:MAG: hypothetical protein ABUK11_01045 [Mariprofundaceae bacterium]